VRSDFGICTLGSKLFSDVRSLSYNSDQIEWILDRPDVTDPSFESRIGHAFVSWDKYLVIFGGCGAFNP